MKTFIFKLLFIFITLSPSFSAKVSIQYDDKWKPFFTTMRILIGQKKTNEEKEAILSRPMNHKVLKTYKKDPRQFLKNQDLYKNIDTSKKINIIALAISLGKDDFIKENVDYISDINDKKWNIWGYRQDYNLAHLALDSNIFSTYFPNQGTKQMCLNIIDILAHKGINFNYTREGNSYMNPPLAAGNPSGRPNKYLDAVRARALIHAADPTVNGSSFYSIDFGKGSKDTRVNAILKEALAQLQEAKEGTLQLNATANDDFKKRLKEFEIKDRNEQIKNMEKELQRLKKLGTTSLF